MNNVIATIKAVGPSSGMRVWQAFDAKRSKTPIFLNQSNQRSIYNYDQSDNEYHPYIPIACQIFLGNGMIFDKC